MNQQPSSSASETIALRGEAPAPAAKKPTKKEKREKADARRSVETMFRITYRNHVALSQLADNKANMLIGVNGLIVSIVLSVIAPRLGSGSWVFAPALVLAAGCIVSLVFAVIGSRPRLNRTPVSVDQVRTNSANILFFGQFARLPLHEFQESMDALVADPRLLQDHLVRQLHEMGRSLETKYRHLHIAYVAFLIGIGAATALTVAVLLGGRFAA